VTSSDAVALTLVFAGTGIGAAIDLRTRRVPNYVTLPLAALGLLVALAGVGRVAPASALLGLVVGLLVMLPGYVFGATGAGDVKLLAAAGTVLGPGGVIWAFLYTAVAGGAIALAVAAWRGRVRNTVDNMLWLVATRGANAPAIECTHANNRFAYAPAIAVGTLLAAWWA
jgi:prepilin peptidase CpaA